MNAAPPSPWLAGLDDKGAPLDGDVEADVAIVGGGYSGLCSALELRREGLDAVVLETETAGFGASGRNAGHLTPTIGKDLPTLTLSLRARARARARAPRRRGDPVRRGSDPHARHRLRLRAGRQRRRGRARTAVRQSRQGGGRGRRVRRARRDPRSPTRCGAAACRRCSAAATSSRTAASSIRVVTCARCDGW